MNDANGRHTSSLGIDLDSYVNVSLVSTFSDRLKFRLCKDEPSILYFANSQSLYSRGPNIYPLILKTT